MQLDGMRILVTGGAGLVGSTTVDLLLRNHAPREVVVLDNLSRGSLDNLAQAATDPILRRCAAVVMPAEASNRSDLGPRLRSVAGDWWRGMVGAFPGGRAAFTLHCGSWSDDTCHHRGLRET